MRFQVKLERSASQNLNSIWQQQSPLSWLPSGGPLSLHPEIIPRVPVNTTEVRRAMHKDTISVRHLQHTMNAP